MRQLRRRASSSSSSSSLATMQRSHIRSLVRVLARKRRICGGFQQHSTKGVQRHTTAVSVDRHPRRQHLLFSSRAGENDRRQSISKADKEGNGGDDLVLLSSGIFRKYNEERRSGRTGFLQTTSSEASAEDQFVFFRSFLTERRRLKQRLRRLARRVILECTATSGGSDALQLIHAAAAAAANDGHRDDIWQQIPNGTALLSSLSEDVNCSPTSLELELELASKFVVLVVGGANSGKSSVINTLLIQPPAKEGEDSNSTVISNSALLETDALPGTTARPMAVKLPSQCATAEGDDATYHYDGDDSAILFIDTPGWCASGTNNSNSNQLMNALFRIADAVWVVTSAEAPLAQPEERSAILKTVTADKQWTVLVNKMDLLEYQYASGNVHGDGEKDRIRRYTEEQVRTILRESFSDSSGERSCDSFPSEDPSQRVTISVLAVSARQAQAAKHLVSKRKVTVGRLAASSASSSTLLQRSNWEVVDSYIRDRMSPSCMVRAKLATPLGVARTTAAACLSRLDEESEHLEADVATIRSLSTHASAWRNRLKAETSKARERIRGAVLQRQSSRGHDLVRRIGGGVDFWMMTLWDQKRLQSEWERTAATNNGSVVAASPSAGAYLSFLVNDVADSIAVQARAQGQNMIEFLGRRPSSSPSSFHQSLVGSVIEASSFQDTKQRLHDNILQAIQDHAVDHSRRRDGQGGETAFVTQLASHAQSVALLNAGALVSFASASAVVLSNGSASGAPVAVAAAGICLGSAFCLGSMAMTYARGPEKLAQQYEESWQAKGDSLDRELDAIFRRELRRIEVKVQEGVNPYTEFVGNKAKAIEALSIECKEVMETSIEFKKKLDSLGC